KCHRGRRGRLDRSTAALRAFSEIIVAERRRPTALRRRLAARQLEGNAQRQRLDIDLIVMPRLGQGDHVKALENLGLPVVGQKAKNLKGIALTSRAARPRAWIMRRQSGRAIEPQVQQLRSYRLDR